MTNIIFIFIFLITQPDADTGKNGLSQQILKSLWQFI